MSAPVTRRHFLGGFLALLVAPLGLDGRRRLDREAQLVAAHLAGCFEQRESVAALGRACLESALGEVSPAQLLAAMRRELEVEASDPFRAQAGELHRFLERRSREDFAAGRVVAVRGWRLSRTEARVFALVSLA